MGKWDRRWMPRRRYNNNRKYKDYDYEEPPPSPPSPHHSQSNPPVIQDGIGSSWEIDFCKAVWVPWQKVVTAKKYMYCHKNILHWDDSAGEQAFQNAKCTYWKKINGLPSKTPLPDPDIYIDNIDWSPKIDPELIAELDREYFHPDDMRIRRKLDTKTGEVYKQDPRDLDNGSNNPWEKESSHKVDCLNGQSENLGDFGKSVSVKNVSNPWEESVSSFVKSSNNTSWTKHVNDSSSWNQHQRECMFSKSARDASWQRGCKEDRYHAETGWREDDPTCGWKPWKTSHHDRQISVQKARWQNASVSHTEYPPNKTWENKQLKRSFEGSFGSDRGWQSGWRNRGGYFNDRQRYKTSRFQIDDHGADYRWQKERSHNSVHFNV